MTVATAVVSPPCRQYETIYILKPDVAKDQAAGVAARVKEAVAREGGRFTSVETWGRRRLAYEIGRYRHGIYVYVSYIGGGGLVAELERNLRLLDAVMRFQTVVTADSVDAATLDIQPEAVVFEAVEGVAEDNTNDRIRELGLLDDPRMFSRPEPSGDDEDGEPRFRGKGKGKDAESSTAEETTV